MLYTGTDKNKLVCTSCSALVALLLYSNVSIHSSSCTTVFVILSYHNIILQQASSNNTRILCLLLVLLVLQTVYLYK